MTATHTQDTTVDANLVTRIAQQMIAQEPLRQRRIEAALSLVLLNGVQDTAECGVYLVRSQERPDTYYRATSYTCGCCDHRKRGVTCKHSTACTIRQVALAEQHFETWRQQFEQRRAAREA